MDFWTYSDVIRTLRQFIARSAENTANVSSDDEIGTPARIPHAVPLCNPDKLNKNDISYKTKLACGYVYGEHVNKSVTSIIQNRQLGPRLTCSQIRRISNNYLPNKIQKIDRYDGKSFCATYSRDGDSLVTASQDNYIRFYSTKNGVYKMFKKISCQHATWSVLDVAISPDGNHMAYSSWSDTLYICPIHAEFGILEAIPFESAELGKFCISSLAFSSDNRKIIGAAKAGYLCVYDIECYLHLGKIKVHSKDANCVTFADDTSQIVYTGGDDGLCKVWDRRILNGTRPHPIGTLAGHIDGITYIDPRGDGRYLITNSKDQTIKLWDTRILSSREVVKEIHREVVKTRWDYRWQEIPRKYFSPNRPKIEGDASIMTYAGHMVVQTLIKCHFSPIATTGQRFIYTGCGSGKVIIYDLLTGRIVATLEGHRGCVKDANWHPYRHEILSSSWDGRIGLWRYFVNERELSNKWIKQGLN